LRAARVSAGIDPVPDKVDETNDTEEIL